MEFQLGIYSTYMLVKKKPHIHTHVQTQVKHAEMTIHCLLQLRSCGCQQKYLKHIHRYSPIVLNIWKICVWARRGYIAVNEAHQGKESTGKLRQLQNMNLLGLDS